MSIKKDKDNSDVFVVDTLADLFKLLADQGIYVRINDNCKLRDFELEELEW
jgi:putative N-acetylmannosamine-6-phosphate epimerase